jgi:hypothetical protein
MAFKTVTRVVMTTTGSGIQGSDVYMSPPIVNENAPGPGPQPVVLASGTDTTVPVPAGCTEALIVSSDSSTLAKILKKVTGDQVPMHSSKPFLYSFPNGTASFIINCAAPGETVLIHWG